MERCPCCEEPWTREEDDRLFAHIQSRGEGSWTSMPDAAGLKRCGKNCQIRWINSLLPDLNRWNISDDEEQLIVKLHALLGNRWSLIAGRLPGRTGNEIKNYWNIHISRKLLSQGIDPNSHRPFHYVDNESSTTNSHSLHHGNDQTVDYTVNFELGEASTAGNRNEERPYVNLDLSISLPCYSRETVDAKEGTDEMKFPSVG